MIEMFTQLDDHTPLSNSLPEQRAATMARGSLLRRRRQGAWLGAVGAIGVLVVVTGLTLPRTTESLPAPLPAATSTPLPEPTGPTLEMYPLCADECPASQPAARYRSVLRGDESEVPFTVVLPAGWHSLGGDYPEGYGYYPQGSRSFSAAGAVSNADDFGVSLIADDGRAGMVLIPNPAVVDNTNWAGGGLHYVAPPGGYANWLATLSSDTRPTARTVSGYEATALDLAASTTAPPPQAAASGDCRVARACIPVVSYHIPPVVGGGSGPPTMGRLAAPTRLVLVTVPNTAEPFQVVIWLWDVGTNGDSTDEVLRNVQPILDTMRFEGPRPLTRVS